MEALQIARKGLREKGPLASVSPSPTTRLVLARKFMQTLDDQVYRDLSRFAQARGVTVQGLIRAVIVPEWIISQDNERVKQSQRLASLAESGVKSGDPAPADRNPLLFQR